jgi:SagB-type dehydrogenase family enzyme
MENEDFRDRVAAGRRFLHAEWELWEKGTTDQDKGLPAPDQDTPLPPGTRCVSLPPPAGTDHGSLSVREVLGLRRSRRKFAADPLTLQELSFLLWATQGVTQRGERRSLRTAPSAGARHSLDTYLYLDRVDGAEQGLWRYRPFDHAIALLKTGPDLGARMDAALMDQLFGAAAVFAWVSLPYRMEWRYAPVAHKLIALDAGHVCQNLYLACESIGCGTCAIGAYQQQEMDALLGVDGDSAFCVYAAPVGRKPAGMG